MLVLKEIFLSQEKGSESRVRGKMEFRSHHFTYDIEMHSHHLL